MERDAWGRPGLAWLVQALFDRVFAAVERGRGLRGDRRRVLPERECRALLGSFAGGSLEVHVVVGRAVQRAARRGRSFEAPADDRLPAQRAVGPQGRSSLEMRRQRAVELLLYAEARGCLFPVRSPVLLGLARTSGDILSPCDDQPAAPPFRGGEVERLTGLCGLLRSLDRYVSWGLLLAWGLGFGVRGASEGLLHRRRGPRRKGSVRVARVEETASRLRLLHAQLTVDSAESREVSAETYFQTRQLRNDIRDAAGRDLFLCSKYVRSRVR